MDTGPRQIICGTRQHPARQRRRVMRKAAGGGIDLAEDPFCCEQELAYSEGGLHVVAVADLLERLWRGRGAAVGASSAFVSCTMLIIKGVAESAALKH